MSQQPISTTYIATLKPTATSSTTTTHTTTVQTSAPAVVPATSSSAIKPTVRTVANFFIPPLYKNLGKSGKDVLKKRYDLAHSFKSVRKSTDRALTVEYGLLPNASVINGYVKSKYVTAPYEVEGEASTDVNADTKIQVRVPHFYPGVQWSATVNARPDEKAFKSSVVSSELEYVTSSLATNVEAKSDLTNHRIKGSAVLGYDGVSVGGTTTVDVSNGVDVIDYNVGIEYAQPSYTATLYSEQSFDYATLAYYQRIASYHTLAAQFRVELAGNHSSALTVGNDYAIDAVNSVKTKVEVPSGIVTAAIEHRLPNPSVALNLAAVFTPLNFLTKGIAADRFGLNITVGDY